MPDGRAPARLTARAGVLLNARTVHVMGLRICLPFAFHFHYGVFMDMLRAFWSKDAAI